MFFQVLSLSTTMLAFYFLFVGAGRQKVFQKKLAQPKKYGLDFFDSKKRPDGWTWGVFFYG